MITDTETGLEIKNRPTLETKTYHKRQHKLKSTTIPIKIKNGHHEEKYICPVCESTNILEIKPNRLDCEECGLSFCPSDSKYAKWSNKRK